MLFDSESGRKAVRRGRGLRAWATRRRHGSPHVEYESAINSILLASRLKHLYRLLRAIQTKTCSLKSCSCSVHASIGLSEQTVLNWIQEARDSHDQRNRQLKAQRTQALLLSQLQGTTDKQSDGPDEKD